MLIIGLIFFLQSDLFAAVDCGNANLAVEKMICHSTRAEKSDREMSFAYRQALKKEVFLQIYYVQHKESGKMKLEINVIRLIV